MRFVWIFVFFTNVSAVDYGNCITTPSDNILYSEVMNLLQWQSFEHVDFYIVSDTSNLSTEIIQNAAQIQIALNIDGFFNLSSTVRLSSGNSCSHLVIVAIPKNEQHFAAYIHEISAFYFEAKGCNPIFLTAISEILVINNPTVLQDFAKYFDIISNVYLITFNFQKELGNVEKKNDIERYNFILWEIYHIYNESVVHQIDIGSDENGMHFYDYVAKNSRRWDMGGVPVTGVAVDNHEYELAQKYKPDVATVEFESGFDVDGYRYLRDAMNFTEKAVRGIGYILEGPNGTLLGLAIQVNNGEADVIISSSEFLQYRICGPDALSYLHSTFDTPILAMFQQPPHSSIRNLFYQAFSPDLWLILFFTVVCIALSLKLADRITNKFGEPLLIQEDDLSHESCVLFSVGSLCQQGWHIWPSSTPKRIIAYSGLSCGLIVYIAYSAALVSIISVEDQPVKELNDLLLHGFNIYSDQHIPTAKLIVKILQNNNMIKSLPENASNIAVALAMTKIINSRSALITLSDAFYPVIIKRGYDENFICQHLSKISISLQNIRTGMLVRKGWPFRDLFNFKILVMQERGIKRRLVKQYVLETSVQCLEREVSPLTSLGINDVFAAYIILLLGIGFSFVILVIEKIVFNMYILYFD